jgi:predicted anti-sigma-YlaC factor YlaD
LSTQEKPIRCRDIYLAVSSYLEGDVDPQFRKTIEEHIKDCDHCSAIYDGTMNVLRLVAEDRVLEVPLGFQSRLYSKLKKFIEDQS